MAVKKQKFGENNMELSVTLDLDVVRAEMLMFFKGRAEDKQINNAENYEKYLDGNAPTVVWKMIIPPTKKI